MELQGNITVYTIIANSFNSNAVHENLAKTYKMYHMFSEEATVHGAYTLQVYQMI